MLKLAVIGLQGQPRRMYVWTEARAGEGFFNLGFWNLVASLGSLVLAVGVLLFVVNIVVSHRNHGPAPLDPWDARSLEWLTTNPPKEHNFDVIPTVNHLEEFFHRKYEDRGVDGHPDFQKVATAEEIIAQQEADADAHIHLPSPSYWPIVTAFSLPIIAYGVIFNLVLVAVGAMILLIGVFGWGLEPHTAPDHDYDPLSVNEGVELDTISRE